MIVLIQLAHFTHLLSLLELILYLLDARWVLQERSIPFVVFIFKGTSTSRSIPTDSANGRHRLASLIRHDSLGTLEAGYLTLDVLAGSIIIWLGDLIGRTKLCRGTCEILFLIKLSMASLLCLQFEVRFDRESFIGIEH